MMVFTKLIGVRKRLKDQLFKKKSELCKEDKINEGEVLITTGTSNVCVNYFTLCPRFYKNPFKEGPYKLFTLAADKKNSLWG